MVRTAGMVDGFDDSYRGGEGGDDVTLGLGERFHQQGDVALLRVVGNGGKAVDEVLLGFRGREATGSGALFGGAEDHHAGGAEVAAEVNEGADVFPTCGAERVVGRGDVDRFGSDQKPVETDKGEAFIDHHALCFGALGGREVEGILRKCERGDFDTFIADSSEGATDIQKRFALEGFITHRVAKWCSHYVSPVWHGDAATIED
jgi:hypothetical protein